MALMEQKSIRIFVSGELIRQAETQATVRASGRPILHSTCLVLAMIGIKVICNMGYRETQKFFEERGYAKLPDFRTVHYRVNALKRKGLHIAIETKNGRDEYSVLIKFAGNGAFAKQKSVSGKEWDMHMRGIKTDFVELAL